MTVYYVADKPYFWIVHDPSLHFGILNTGGELRSGQQYLELFDDESAWAARVVDLGGVPYPEEDDGDYI